MELDVELAIWRRRPLSVCPYLFVDARYEWFRHDGHVVPMTVLIAYGVNADGYRQILDVAVKPSEKEADYTRFFRGLQARGLSGIQLVVSNDHPGLKQAITYCFPAAHTGRADLSQ